MRNLLFVLLILLVIAGLYRYVTGGSLEAARVAQSAGDAVGGVGGLTLFLVLKAFASGCTAMTGVEAIANLTGVMKKPVSTCERCRTSSR